MNHTKRFLWVAPFALLTALSSCGEKGSSYSVALARPTNVRMISEDTFTWIPVTGASGYVAKLDEGEPFGIAVTTQVDASYENLCYYSLPTENLTDGKHTIRFASRTEADVLSDWTNAYTFAVKNEITLARPYLGSSLCVESYSKFDTVTYTFNGSITATHALGKDATSYTPTEKDLKLSSLLTKGASYVVTCLVSYNGIVSEASNPVTYTYEPDDKFIAAETPMVDGVCFTFKEKITNPTFSVKLDGKEYVLEMSNEPDDSFDVGYIISALLNKELIDDYAILDAKSHTFALKVMYDDDHYLPSEYSATMTYTQEDLENYSKDWSDKEIFYDLTSTLYYHLDIDDDFTKAVLSYSKKRGYKYITVSARDEKGNELSVIKGDDRLAWATIELNGAKMFYLTLSYSHLGYNDSYTTVYYNSSATASPFVYDVKPSSSYVEWKVSVLYSNYQYDVVVSDGTTTKVYKTNVPFLKYDEIDLEGDLKFTVYVYENGSRIASSKSDTVSLYRRNAPAYVGINSDLTITLDPGMTVYLYQYIGSSDVAASRSYSSSNKTNDVSISGYKKVKVFYASDGVSTIDSKKLTCFINEVSAVKYSVLDGGYIYLEDGYSLFDVVDDEYKEYIVSKDSKTVFDMAAYHQATSLSSLALKGKVDSYLWDGDTATLVNATISLDVAPEVTLGWIAQNNQLQITPESNYEGKYDVCVYKYDTEINDYVLVSEKTISDTLYEFSGITEEGTYRIAVRTHGNGSVLPGYYSYYTYTV
jgi:hypothetical protein